MSDILSTAKLYNKDNTFRSDNSGSTKGNARNVNGTAIGFDCSGLVYHVLRESGYNVPYAASGAMSSSGSFSGAWATKVNDEKAVAPGTLVYFNGHVGIVNSYNPETKTGTFLSMTGQKNEGRIKPEEPFTTDKENKNPNITWGKTTAFNGFAAVKQELYDPQLDQHANGANANTPVFNIPEHKTAGFITLPQNGGFPTIKESKDLSAVAKIVVANQGVTQQFGLEAAVGTTPFAKTLAYLESRDQPNDGYTAQARDKDAKGNVLPGIGAIGRYGFRAGSLKAIGWMDDKGEWTDAAKAQGVDSVSTFQDNPDAQEFARVSYIQVLKGELRNNEAWKKIGTTVNGEEVTEAGLIAAAWKEGSGPVGKFFNGQSISENAEKNIKFRLGKFEDVSIGASDSAGEKSGVATSIALGDDKSHSVIDPTINRAINWVASKLPPELVQLFEPTNKYTDTDGAGANANGTRPPAADVRTPYVALSTPVKNADGTTTTTGIATGDSSDGFIKKGDVVAGVSDENGKTIAVVVVHKTANGTIVKEHVIGADGQPTTETYTQTDKNGDVVSQMTTSGGEVLGDTYIEAGITYTRTPNQKGVNEWLDPNGKTQGERYRQGISDSDVHLNRSSNLDPTDPASSNAVNGSDLQSDKYKPPTPPTEKAPTTSNTEPPPSLTPVAFQPPDSEGYTAGPNGTSNRPISGQPGLMELRDSDGSGYIVDTIKGTIVSVLQPGDQVGTTDDMRITVNDEYGHAVDRMTDVGRADSFATGMPLSGSDAPFSQHGAGPEVRETFSIVGISTSQTLSASASLSSTTPTGETDFGASTANRPLTSPRPEWLIVLQGSEHAGTKEVARLLETSDFARTFDQIQRSPTLQQDIVDFVTGTGRFEGREPGRLSTESINAGGGAYTAGDNTVRIASDRLQGVDANGNKLQWPDGAAVVGHEIQHACNRADVDQLPSQSDPNFSNAASPKVVWNNLLDEADGQLRQYRIAKEIYDSQGWSFEVDPFQVRPQLSMGDVVPFGQVKDSRAQQIEQWLEDGAELYRHGLIPSPDYLARANLAVDIGNNERVSVEGGSTNYIDYYANNDMRTQGDPQRMQHVEISGIENGKLSVTFSSKGDEPRLIRLTQPVEASADGPWSAEICRPVPANAGDAHAPASLAAGQEFEVVQIVSSDGQGNTTVTDAQTGTAVTTSTWSSTGWGGEANHPPTVETQAPPVTSTDHNGPDPYDNHLTRYPVPNSTSGESDTGFTQIEPPAPVNAASPATTIAAPKTPEQLRADALLEAQVADANTAMGFASSIIGLRNWGSQDGLGRLSTAVNFYNQFDRLGASFGGSGNNLPGDLGQFGAGLGVISALKSGNPISIASSGASFYNSIVGANAANAIPIPVLNSLNLINALNSGNPLSIATSAVSFIPVYGPLLSIGLSVFGALVGGNSGPPPPPDGAVHYTWDESGAITIQTDHNVSKGAETATSTAGSVLGLLNSVVTAQNGQNDAAGQSHNNVAIDPSRMPRIGHTAGQNWLEVTHPDGTTTKETIDPATIGQRMVEIAIDNGALAPAWQVQTAQAHARAEHTAQAQAAASATPTDEPVAESPNAIDGQAPTAAAPAQPNLNNNTNVFGVEGKAVESADHKTQSFGALVVHLSTPQAQQHLNALATPATNTVLLDTDGDGFFEQTQWVAGQDSQGNVQGMLVLDRNNNGLIENADILHLGNSGDNSNQHNSMNWLDSNGDGKLDASDPAFAAIKLFVDLNNNGRVDDGEMQGTGLSSINFTTGQVNYSNGTSDALTATTLTAETEGSKVDKIKVVGEDGKLYELNAGSVIVHEGYQGLVRVNNKGEIVADDDPAADNRWVQQRINSYTFNAAHQSDWEGTDKQDQHRHGGKNVEGAPTETSATGATSRGPVLGKENVKTYTTMDVGDKRLVSDAPRTSADGGNTNTAPTTITLNVGDARIRSLTPPADQAARVVFVPSGVREGWMTADGKQLLHMPDDGLFGAGGTGSALTAVALGAVQTTAFAVPDKGAAGFTWQTRPLLQDATNTHSGNNSLNFGSTTHNNNTDSGNASPFGVSAGNYGTVRQLRLGVLLGTAPMDPAHGQAPTYVVGTNTTGTAGGGAAPWQTTVFDYGTPPSAFAADGSAMPQQPVIYNPATGKRPATTQPNPTTPTSDALTPPASSAPAAPQPGAPLAATTPVAPTAPSSPTFTVPPAAPPTNTSASTTNDNLSNPLEDLPLRVGFATLLANDTNASAITLVGNAANGTVAIVGSEVVFTPTPNYHGPASFQYQVVSLDGSFAVGQANFDISAVNDVPLALGETAAATEDTVLQISAASLLANDTDADIATDNQTLTISAVGSASHGTVSLVNGQVQFTPDANYHGTASFKYVVSDGNGGTATATATVQVAAVNDVPVALGEVISGAEDTTLLINPLALLANDTDADVATDNQVLGISSVGNATHGTVSILGTGQIRFVPDANYVGTASFDYVVNDGNGGTVTTTANILVGSTNDAPVASGETVNSQEDQVVTLTAPALLANETDVDNSISSLQIARVTAGTGGSVVLSGGNILFTPNANFSGTASFTYWVKDPDGMESNPATVTVNVAPVNDAPYAQGEVVTGASEDATFTIDRSILLANDGDEEDSNSSLGIELVGNASSGTISMGGGGNLVFTPVANFNGNVSFQYQVRDTSGALSPVVTAQFNVAAVNDTPLGVDEQLTPMYTNTVASPSTATIGFSSLLGNDSDVDNPASDLTVSGVRNASNGTVSIVGGAVVFTPTVNFNGTASFQYQVDDQHGGQTWATAYISVAPPPNLYPSINVTYSNFYPTGTTPAGAWDMGDLNWTIADDGNTGLVSVTYLSGSYHVFGNAGGNVSSLPWNDFVTTRTSWHVDVPRTHAVDAFATTWRVVDDRGLENTWHFNYTVGSGFQSYMAFTGYAPPVVLGLNGNSPGYIETQYSNVRYDLNGDGIADQVAWAAPGSGVLGIDLNGDHQISNASEFAFTQYVPGAKTDLEGLRAFDSNHNGLLDVGDAQWAKFGVWEDKNSDGQTQAGEYLTLDTLGIAHISLNGHAPTHPQEKPADGHLTGVAVVGESTFMRTDGSTGQVDDAMLAFQPAPQSEAADLMRMALLFNQYSNTAMDGGSAPLGYVPLQAETPWQEAALTAPQHAMHEVLQSA